MEKKPIEIPSWSNVKKRYSEIDPRLDPKSDLEDRLKALSIYLGKWIEINGKFDEDLPYGYVDQMHDLLITVDDFIDWAEDYTTYDPG